MGDSIGIRELNSKLSAILRRVRKGESITVTDRGRAVAVIVPAGDGRTGPILEQLARTGRITWSGGKPTGCRNPPRNRGRPVSDLVIEDRR